GVDINKEVISINPVADAIAHGNLPLLQVGSFNLSIVANCDRTVATFTAQNVVSLKSNLLLSDLEAVSSQLGYQLPLPDSIKNGTGVFGFFKDVSQTYTWTEPIPPKLRLTSPTLR